MLVRDRKEEGAYVQLVRDACVRFSLLARGAFTRAIGCGSRGSEAKGKRRRRRRRRTGTIVVDMPHVLLGDSIAVELEAQEPWPQPITLYQPYEVEQILLPDNANCLAVQAFLKMCQLDFQIEPRKNAEFMSPSGRVPFIRCGTKLISEFDGIVAHIGSKGVSLSDHLDPAGKVDMRAYQSLVNNVFVNAELYICWVDPTILNGITKQRHGSVYPWPLNHYLNWQKRREVIKKLSVLGWYNKSLDEVFDDVRKCCIALSERLADEEFFFGKDPTEVDALVYGHIHALTSPSFPQEVTATIHQFPKLIEHMFRIERRYFGFGIQNEIAEEFEIIESASNDTLWDGFQSQPELLPALSDYSFTLSIN